MGFSFETPILSSFYFSKFVNSRDRDTNVKFQSAGQTSGNRHRQDLLNPKKAQQIRIFEAGSTCERLL